MQFDLLETVRLVTSDSRTCSPGNSLPRNSICHNELSSFYFQCSTSTSDELLVSTSRTLLLQQYMLLFFGNGLDILVKPSLECNILLRHVHCLLGYEVCDGNRSLQLSRESCEAIRDHICVKEWIAYSLFSGPNGFLNCNEISSSSDECEGMAIHVILLVEHQENRASYSLHNP